MANAIQSGLDHIHLSLTKSRRIQKTLELDRSDILEWCKEQIADPEAITKTKNHCHIRGRGFVMVIDIQTYEIMSVRKEKPKKGSNMDDVNIVKKLDDIPELKQNLIAVFDAKTHRRISNYSLLLADHILQLTNTPKDETLESCYQVNRRWQDGEAHFQEARDIADQMHVLARHETDLTHATVLRVMGQVAVTPHVKRHALIASDYAVKVVNLLYPGNWDEVRKERELQIALMQSI